MNNYEATKTVIVFLDVDTPYDLATSNIQAESSVLTWKPPRAEITGYILSFESVDGAVRVRRHYSTTGCCNWLVVTNAELFVSSLRRWSWVPPLCLITWLSWAPPLSTQWSCRPLPGQRGAKSLQASSPQVSRLRQKRNWSESGWTASLLQLKSVFNGSELYFHSNWDNESNIYLSLTVTFLV